jgi:hypothetical protein
MTIDNAAIREAAYYKWLAAGEPESDGLEFWLQAEREWQQPTAEEAFDEASEESFPASDPPARTTAASRQPTPNRMKK